MAAADAGRYSAGVSRDATLFEGNEEPADDLHEDRCNLFSGGSTPPLPLSRVYGGKMTERAASVRGRFWDEGDDGTSKTGGRGRLDTAFFNQGLRLHACGGREIYPRMNAVIAPDANHITRPNAKATDQALAAGDEMSLALIDKMVESAKLGSTTATGPAVRPINVDGDDRYVLVMHTKQVTQLRAAVGAGSWLDIQKAAMTGDGSKGNPIMTGALGMYNGAVLHRDRRASPTASIAALARRFLTARRSVLMGAQACAIGFGQGQSFKNFDWNEELFDYGNQLGVEAGLIHGLKKLRFNARRIFGTIPSGSTFTSLGGLHEMATGGRKTQLPGAARNQRPDYACDWPPGSAG